MFIVDKRTIALTRDVSTSINHCELTHATREPIDVELARIQHHQYTTTLSALGCHIIQLPELPLMPDAVFIEDTAVVFAEIAVITRMGAISRCAETPSVAAKLSQYRKLITIETPGTLEGGDVLVLGKHIYVGVSSRSNQEGIRQLQLITSPYGYIVHAVSVTACLHLKSAVSQITEDAVLLNPAWVDPDAFNHLIRLVVDPQEPYAANALRIDTHVIYPTAYPRTMQRLERTGISIIPVDVSELIKAEGAVTCCSLIFTQDLS
jgi:dimethylargininase